jgi:metal-sulfur cluster biosynthetic enzyme
MSTSTSRVRREAVLERIARVTDPELDRSIVELGYLDELSVGPETAVRFRLPTAWCSPAFAWMMASDIRDQVGSLEGVEAVEVRLVDHMHAAEITDGVNAGLAFEAVFEDATEGIDAVRATLDEKARRARQYRAVEALLDAGVHPKQVCELVAGDLTFDRATGRAAVALDGLVVYAPLEPLAEYVEKARQTGVVTGPADRLFVTLAGESIEPEAFETVHRWGRLAQVNMSGQGAVCDALHRARYGGSGIDTGTGD